MSRPERASDPRVAELVGRVAELRAVTELLAGPPDRGGALLLRGEAGIGKTALLGAAAALGEGRGFQVLTTVGAEAESGAPFAGLHALVRPLLGQADELPEHLRDALLAAFGLVDATVPALFAVALASLELLAAAASRAPVLLIADDVHWLDGASAEVVAFLSRRIHADPVVLLAAGRTHEWPQLGSGIPEIAVGPLERDEAAALLADRAQPLSGPARRALLEQAEGNPLALVELAHAMAADGPPPGGAAVPGVLRLTDRLQATFDARLGALPEPTRLALLTAALDPAATIAEVLDATGTLSGVEPSPVVLDPAVASGLVAVVAGEGVRFRHPLMRSAVFQRASLSRRYAAHAALAQAVADPERWLWHRTRATVGFDAELADAVDEAARRAERRGAIAAAVGHLERAAILTPAPERRAARLAHAADLSLDLGQADETRRLVRAVVGLEMVELDRARTRLLQLTLDDPLPDDPAPTHELIGLSERALAADDTVLALRLLLAAALRCWWGEPGLPARRALVAAAKRVPVPRSDARVIAILAEASPIEDVEELMDRVSRIDEGQVVDPESGRRLGVAAYIVGEYALSARLLDQAAERFRREGRLALLAGVLVVRGWDAVGAGEWALAEQAVDEALRLAADAGQPGWMAGAQMLQSVSAGLRGDEEGHRRWAAEAERHIRAHRATAQLRVLRIARGTVAAVGGRHQEAYALIEPLFDRDDPTYDARTTFDVIGYFADAAAQTGRGAEAVAHLTALERVLPERRPPVVCAALDYAAAVLADDEAEARFASALAGPAASRPFDLARLQLAHGRWLRRRRRITEARGPLRAARDAFDRLGNRPYGDRARDELRAAGESSSRRADFAWDALSPQEAQIARLVAEGLSNREIGQRLFLSHRTVGSHLYRMFPKLGITSRIELAAVANDG